MAPPLLIFIASLVVILLATNPDFNDSHDWLLPYKITTSVFDVAGVSLAGSIVAVLDTRRTKGSLGSTATTAATLIVLLFIGCKLSVLDWDAMSHAETSAATVMMVITAVVWCILGLWKHRVAAQVEAKAAADLLANDALYSKLVDDEEGGAEGGKRPGSAGDKKGGSEMDDDDEADELPTWRVLLTLKPYFWPRQLVGKMSVLTTWFMVVVSKAANVLAPLYIAKATNSLADERIKDCMVNVAVYGTLLLVSKISKEAQSLVYLRVAQAAYSELAEDTFGHVHKLSLNWHLKKKMGEVVRVIDRGINACDLLMRYGVLYLGPAIGECLSVCIMFLTYFQDPSLAAVVFCCLGLYSFVTVYLTLWRKKFRSAMNKQDNKWHDRITDSLTNFETVKYFTNESYEKVRFQEAVSGYQKYSVDVQASLSLLNIVQQVIMNGCLAVSLVLSAKAYDEGKMDVGDFVAVNVWIVQLFTPLNFLGSVYNTIITSFVDLRNLSQLMGQQPDIVDRPNAPPMPKPPHGSALEVAFHNVRFQYPGQRTNSGLQGVSFTAKSGTTTAVVGHTGAGKTTVSRLLFRFYDPASGRVTISGRDVKAHSQASVRDLIGVVPQDTVLFNDTIAHNIRYGKLDATEDEIEEAARGAQILDFIQGLPEGWDTVVGERGLKLSGGEKQRVAIARCLLKDPPIVLLDEATSALDSLTERSVQKALNKLGEQRTVLVIAHRLGTIQHADQIIVLEKGAIIEKGDHHTLVSKAGKYAEMWDMQAKAAAAAEEEEVAEGEGKGAMKDDGEEESKTEAATSGAHGHGHHGHSHAH